MKVVVVGGGIGGLTSAVALQARGIEAHVYERAEELRPVGAGILMPPNALGVFERLGFAGEVVERGVQISRFQVLDRTGLVLQRLEGVDLVADFGRTTVAIERTALHEVLRRQLEPGSLHLGHDCRRVDEDGAQATVKFDAAASVTADLVVAADGLRSRIRGRIFPESVLRYSGQSCYRGLARLRLPRSHHRVFNEIWGEKRRFGFSPVSEEAVYWYAPFDAPVGEAMPADPKSLLLESYKSFTGPLEDIIQATPEADFIRTDLYDIKPPRAWTKGRIALLGDAAHAATPNLGQGSAQAIEDAHVLAEGLAQSPDVATALEAYQQRRRPRADEIISRSRAIGRISHWSNPAARALRNRLMKAVPDRLNQRQMTRYFHPA